MTPPVAATAEALPRSRPGTRRSPTSKPRRVSGPARPARSPRPAGGERAAARPGLALRAFGLYRRLADSPLLDRLARGRLWIGLLAFALIGIVAMQLMVLKLNAGIGATLSREAGLQRENVQLGIEASTAAGEGRVEPLAAASGMAFAPPGSIHFVAAAASDVEHAVAALAAPIQPREASGAEAVSGGASGEASTGPAEASASGAEAKSGETATSGGETSPASAASVSNGASETAPAASATGAETTSQGAPASAPTGASGTSAAASTATPSGHEAEASSAAAGGVSAGG